MTASLKLDQLRGDVAEALGEPAATLADDENLLDRGLDSIRIMSLVERWRRAGHEAGYLDLAQEPTLAAWHALLAKPGTAGSTSAAAE